MPHWDDGSMGVHHKTRVVGMDILYLYVKVSLT